MQSMLSLSCIGLKKLSLILEWVMSGEKWLNHFSLFLDLEAAFTEEYSFQIIRCLLVFPETSLGSSVLCGQVHQIHFYHPWGIEQVILISWSRLGYPSAREYSIIILSFSCEKGDLCVDVWFGLFPYMIQSYVLSVLGHNLCALLFIFICTVVCHDI